MVARCCNRHRMRPDWSEEASVGAFSFRLVAMLPQIEARGLAPQGQEKPENLQSADRARGQRMWEAIVALRLSLPA